MANNVEPKTNGTTNRVSNVKGEKAERITIKYPNFLIMEQRIVSTSPMVQNKFSVRTFEQIKADQEAGSTSKKGKKHEAKDFERCYQEATYKTEDGRYGIPAAAFRNALISACKVCGFHMTKAKLSVFVLQDGIDAEDSTPLVCLDEGVPEMLVNKVRLPKGVVDIRARPVFKEWSATVRMRYDGDQFTPQDMLNLMMRVGMQVGIGEGRHDSRDSAGQGWGCFRLEES